MESRSYTVYVLRNPQGKRYIGLTEHLETRIGQHNSGISTWTRSRGPWTCIWSESAHTLSSARQLESFLKRQKGGVGFFSRTGLTRDTAPPAGS